MIAAHITGIEECRVEILLVNNSLTILIYQLLLLLLLMLLLLRQSFNGPHEIRCDSVKSLDEVYKAVVDVSGLLSKQSA